MCWGNSHTRRGEQRRWPDPATCTGTRLKLGNSSTIVCHLQPWHEQLFEWLAGFTLKILLEGVQIPKDCCYGTVSGGKTLLFSSVPSLGSSCTECAEMTNRPRCQPHVLEDHAGAADTATDRRTEQKADRGWERRRSPSSWGN